MGGHRDFLLELLKANRSSAAVSKNRTEQLVKVLHFLEANPSEVLLNKLNELFALESYHQLKEALTEFSKEGGDIDELLTPLSSGHREAMEVFRKLNKIFCLLI